MDYTMSDRNVQADPGRWRPPGYNKGRTRRRSPSGRTRTHVILMVGVFLLGDRVFLPQPALGMQPRLRYMSYHCSGTVDVYSEMLLALKPSHLLPVVRTSAREHSMACKVVLRSPPGSRIFLHFLLLRISGEDHHHDRVDVYDKNPTQTKLTPRGGHYGILDRSLVIQDKDGSKVKDYRSGSNEIVVEYVGVPTAQHPGFRILVTVFKSPNSNGVCPKDHFKCPKEEGLCLPFATACDGYANCGMRDAGDERDCDAYETVTDLIDNYSLVYDLVMAMLLPLLVFVSVTVISICCMRRYIRLKITIHAEPSVSFTASNGGAARVKLEDQNTLARLYAPPSYEDVVTPSRAAMMAPPPAYSTVLDQLKTGELEVFDSEDELHHVSPRSRKRLAQKKEARRLKERGDCCNDSISSLDEVKSSSHYHRNGRHERDLKPYKGSYEPQLRRVRRNDDKYGTSTRSSDTDEAEDEKERRSKKKGGKAKRSVCHKRRADDLVNTSEIDAGSREEGNQMLLPHAHHLPNCHPPVAAGSCTEPDDNRPSPFESSHPSNSHSPRFSPGASRTRASPSPFSSPRQPPPPTYSNISGDLPPKYKPKSTDSNSSNSHTTVPTKPDHHSSPLKDSSSPVPRGKSVQGTSVPCVVEMNLCSPSAPTPHPSSKDALPSKAASPSPSSSSATDHDQISHSETESRPASHTNSRTESNGSLAENIINQSMKETSSDNNTGLDSAVSNFA